MFKKSNLRFFTSLVMCVLVMSGINSCSKDEGDYRDKWVGTYSGKEEYVINSVSVSNNINVSVTKAEQSSSKIILTTTFIFDGIYNEAVDVTVDSDGNFVGTFTETIESFSVTVTISNGKISANRVTYSYSAPGYVTTTVTADRL